MRRANRRVEGSATTTNNNDPGSGTVSPRNITTAQHDANKNNSAAMKDLVWSDLPVRHSPPPAGRRRRVPATTISRRHLWGGKHAFWKRPQSTTKTAAAVVLLVVTVVAVVVVVLLLLQAFSWFRKSSNSSISSSMTMNVAKPATDMPLPVVPRQQRQPQQQQQHNMPQRPPQPPAVVVHVEPPPQQHQRSVGETAAKTKARRHRPNKPYSTTTKFQLPPVLDDVELEQQALDFGDLNLRLFADDTYLQRAIYKDDPPALNGEEEAPLLLQDDYDDNYYAFDDDAARNPYVDFDDDVVRTTKTCRRTAWHRRLPIDCNKLHEFDFLSRITQGESKFVGAGAYRQVHLVDLPGDELVVLKEYRWSAEFDYRDFEFMRMDAMVSEMMMSGGSAKSRIVNIYGFCGLGILSEGVPGGDLEAVATPLYADSARDEVQVVLDDKTKVDPKNDLTPMQKLIYALEMAEALQELHGYKGGVIVHDDIHLGQFLIDKDGHLKLHDFNRAEPMLWNEKDQEYCRYRNNQGNGVWRAPEEYQDLPLDEKIDVFSLGVNMYALLTGLLPFYDMEETEDVQQRWIDGDLPPIDKRYKTNSFAEGKLVEVIQKCWEYKADHRIDIFAVVDFLREAVAEAERRQRGSETGQQAKKERKEMMMRKGGK